LARLGRRDEAVAILKDVVNGNGRYSATARPFLAALETGTDLPLAAAAAAAPKAPVPPPPRPAPATP
jgi:hypothetical protein